MVRTPAGFPASVWGDNGPRGTFFKAPDAVLLVGRYPGWRKFPCLPGAEPRNEARCQWRLEGEPGRDCWSRDTVRLPLRGQRRLDGMAVGRAIPLLPVELRPRDSQRASTNSRHCTARACASDLQSVSLPAFAVP